MELDSSDSQESHSVPLSNDVASTVFKFAPYWVFSSTWHCQHPSDTSSESSYVQFSEPQTTEEVLQLYRNRQMKGSNLVVGLESGNLASGALIPSAFCRTLAYVFEVAKSGSTYQPVSADDLARGVPVKGWCEPLWLRGSEGGFSTESEEADPSERAAHKADPAYCLLTSAPFWCYLYNHEPSRAKKTPPREAEQMLEMFRSGCLPDWTPVLGLQHDVSTFNSLPPSLFMPLGALLHLTATGLPCKPVGLAELTRWDKFIGQRTSNGCTQGILQPGASGRSGGRGNSQTGGQAGSTLHTMLSGGSAVSAQNGQNGHMGGQYYTNQQSPQQQSGFYNAPVNYMPYQMHPGAGMYNSAYGAPNAGSGANAPPPMHVMWGFGQYPGGNNGQAGFGSNHAAPPSSFMSGRQTGLESGNSTLQLPPKNAPHHMDPQGWGAGANQRKGRRQNSKKNSSACGSALPPGNMVPPTGAPLMTPTPTQNSGCAGAGRIWETPLFRLFTADATRGSAQAVWWKLVPGGKPLGPIGCEQMIVDYVRGSLMDSHMVCGTTSEVVGKITPSSDLFESVGSLLSQVDQGGHYVLVTLGECFEASSQMPHVNSNSVFQSQQEAPLYTGSKAGGGGWGRNHGYGGLKGHKESTVPLLINGHADAAATVKTVSARSGTSSPKVAGIAGALGPMGLDSSRDQKPRTGGNAPLPDSMRVHDQ